MESKNPTRRRFTPEKIEELDEYGVFVFGSNLNGDHAGGAARAAVEKFGAVMGQAEGLQGQSYAIPTLDEKMQRLPIESIRASVETLYRFADEHPELDFFVTRIGCGIAGFEESEIAGVFKSFEFTPFNVILPMEFTAIRGVKGFGKGMVCSGNGYRKQYRENAEFVEDTAKACKRGMHFVENPLEVFRYYEPNKDGKASEYASVTGSGIVDSNADDSKIAVSSLAVGARISLMDIWKMGMEFTWKKSSFLIDRLSRRKHKTKPNDSNTLEGQDGNTLAGQDNNTLEGQDNNTLAGQDGNTLAGRDGNTLAGQDYNALAGQDYNTLAGRDCCTLAGRDGNTLAGQDYNALAGQDYNTLAGRDYNTLAGRNCCTLAGRNCCTLVGRNCCTLAGQDNNTLAGQDGNTLAGRDGNTLAGEDYNTLAGRDGNTLAGRDCCTLAGRDGNTLAGQDCCTLAGQDGNTLAAKDGSILAARNGSTLAGQDNNTLAGQDGNTLAGGDCCTLAGRDYNTLAGQDGNVIACRRNGRVEMFGTGNIAVGANGTRMRGKVGNAICLVEMGEGNRIVAVKAAIIDGKTLKEDVFYTLKDGEFKEVD